MESGEIEEVDGRFNQSSGERGIRTPKSLRTPVFKTGAIAVLPALQMKRSSCRQEASDVSGPTMIPSFLNHLYPAMLLKKFSRLRAP